MKHYDVEVFSDEQLIVKVDGLIIKNVCLSSNYNRIHKFLLDIAYEEWTRIKDRHIRN